MIQDYFSIQLSGDLRVALPLTHVETVARFQRQIICPIPGIPPFWLGVINQKGSLLWVLDGDRFFELASSLDQASPNLTTVILSCWVKETRQQEVEAQKQRNEKDKLQQEVIKMLLEIEGAQDGDLTVRAKVPDGIVGSIADAFNTTIRKLREIVLQVQNVSDQVSFLARGGENSVRQLSDAAKNQSGEIDQVLENVAGINASIQEVANSASLAAQIARKALTEAREGDSTMDRTVESIEKIRGTVAIASKKVKQLAESSQEISQNVLLI